MSAAIFGQVFVLTNLSEDGNLVRITTECMDIALHPL